MSEALSQLIDRPDSRLCQTFQKSGKVKEAMVACPVGTLVGGAAGAVIGGVAGGLAGKALTLSPSQTSLPHRSMQFLCRIDNIG